MKGGFMISDLETDFKNKYVLGDGFVYGHGECTKYSDDGDVEKYLGIGLTSDKEGLNHLTIKVPTEFFDINCPKYRIILERVYE
jgi:hypothetical protein